MFIRSRFLQIVMFYAVMWVVGAVVLTFLHVCFPSEWEHQIFPSEREQSERERQIRVEVRAQSEQDRQSERGRQSEAEVREREDKDFLGDMPQ